MPGLSLIGCHVQKESLGSGVGGQEVWGFLSPTSLLPALSNLFLFPLLFYLPLNVSKGELCPARLNILKA